jgi:hypothetical protein
VSARPVPGYESGVEDEWMFEAFGAIGAALEQRPGTELLLVYRFPPDMPAPEPAARGFPVGESSDVTSDMAAEEVADVVESRMSRHYTVKRVDTAPISGVVREWVLSERSASPGLDQPMT